MGPHVSTLVSWGSPVGRNVCVLTIGGGATAMCHAQALVEKYVRVREIARGSETFFRAVNVKQIITRQTAASIAKFLNARMYVHSVLASSTPSALQRACASVKTTFTGTSTVQSFPAQFAKAFGGDRSAHYHARVTSTAPVTKGQDSVSASMMTLEVILLAHTAARA